MLFFAFAFGIGVAIGTLAWDAHVQAEHEKECSGRARAEFTKYVAR